MKDVTHTVKKAGYFVVGRMEDVCMLPVIEQDRVRDVVWQKCWGSYAVEICIEISGEVVELLTHVR